MKFVWIQKWENGKWVNLLWRSGYIVSEVLAHLYKIHPKNRYRVQPKSE